MKLLIIGVDGFSKETIQSGFTPSISDALDKNGYIFNTFTDLYSRGWLEIILGEHANKTYATYDRPICNGTLEWYEGYKINDCPDYKKEIIPFWSELHKKNFRVGVVNLPTTYPADNDCSFFISGGGGGAPVTSVPSKEMCYPIDIRERLIDNNYIVDERIKECVIDNHCNTEKKILTRMINKNNLRTKSFIELAKEFKIDCGCIVYKTSSNLAETFRINNQQLPLSKNITNSLREYFSAFEKNVKELQNNFPKTDILFVADHGLIDKRCSFNPNILLQDLGYQYSSTNRSISSKLIILLKRILPFSIKKRLKKSKKINRVAKNNTKFSNLSIAFCRAFGDWRYGIYIYDKQRFGGTVNSENIYSKAEEICTKLNRHHVITKNNIRCFQKSKTDPEWFPDILFDMPDGIHINDQINMVLRNEKIKIKNLIKTILSGRITVIKSSKPLVALLRKCSDNKFDPPELLKLTDIKKIINMYFK
jgi:hypothetical protein